MFINKSKELVYMSSKEKLASMLDLIGENEAQQILAYVISAFSLKPKTWDDIEEDDPLPDEIAAFEEYHAARN
jgi:hypothetical protein